MTHRRAGLQNTVAGRYAPPPALVELNELYNELRELCGTYILEKRLKGMPELEASARSFLYTGFTDHSFTFDVFQLARSLAKLVSTATSCESPVGVELLRSLRPLEGKLQELLAPLDGAYLEKWAQLFKCYALLRDEGDYPAPSAFTVLYQQQLLLPTPRRYGQLHSVARAASVMGATTAVILGRSELRDQALEALKALEVQFLLSDPAELTKASGE